MTVSFSFFLFNRNVKSPITCFGKGTQNDVILSHLQRLDALDVFSHGSVGLEELGEGTPVNNNKGRLVSCWLRLSITNVMDDYESSE